VRGRNREAAAAPDRIGYGRGLLRRRVGLLEQRVEPGARLGRAVLRGGAALEELIQPGARRIGALPFRRGRERGRVELEILAEVPPLLVLDRIGLGLAAGVVVARIVVAAVAATAQVVAARLAFALARDRRADRDRRAAELALEARNGGSVRAADARVKPRGGNYSFISP